MTHPLAIIHVLVGGQRWRRIESLTGAGVDAAVYVVQTLANGDSVVEFGDGVNGQELPTGTTVSVVYRHGEGQAGLVAPVFRMSGARTALHVTRTPDGLRVMAHLSPWRHRRP